MHRPDSPRYFEVVRELTALREELEVRTTPAVHPDSPAWIVEDLKAEIAELEAEKRWWESWPLSEGGRLPWLPPLAA